MQKLKKTAVATLISDKVNFQTKNITEKKKNLW